jgi:hypothetical protein
MISALKEWAVACEAMGAGQTALLIRKGGIHEARFELPARRFLLFPTQVHQKGHLLKPEAQDLYERLSRAHDPAAPIPLRYLAELTDALRTFDEAALRAVSSFHLWSEAYAKERLHWRERQPLHLMLVRVSRLERPREIPPSEELAGCRSWLELPLDEADLAGRPAVDDATYERWRAQLEEALSPFGAERLAV